MDRTTLLGLSDRKIEKVSVPEWNTDVFIRSWTLSERNSMTKNANDPELSLKIIVASLCDAAGNLLLKPEDTAVLSEKNVLALDRISLAAMKLNSITTEKVEETKKN